MDGENRKFFKKGDTILIEKPFVHALKEEFRGKRCDHCFTETSLSRCSGCHYVYYCERKCQKLSWTEHKHECNKLKKMPGTLSDFTRCLSKVLIKLKNGGNEEKSYYTSNRFRTFKDLMSHYNNLKDDPLELIKLSNQVKEIEKYMGKDYFQNSTELLEICGQIRINSFTIGDYMDKRGIGIYLAASVLNHSCVPNATTIFNGTTLVIRAIADIEYTVFENDILISYIDTMGTTQERQNELLKSHFFLCECKLCTANIDNSMMCSNAECQAAIPMKNKVEEISHSVSCPKCLKKISNDKVKLFYDVTDFTQCYLNKNTGSLKGYEICFEKQRNIFHPSNINRIKTLQKAYTSALKLEKRQLSLKYGVLLIEGYRIYYGDYHLALGTLYMDLFNSSIAVGSLESAAKYAKNGLSITKVILGK